MANASQTESANHQIDYQSLEYVDAVDETLLCPVCKTPFHSPITTPCGHTFCAGCINRALETQRTCPIDRQPINKTRDYRRLPLIIKDQLDRLKVRCPNKGCDHVCPREHVEGHFERLCDFSPVRCPDPNCFKVVARRYATPEHGCMHRETLCDYCFKEIPILEFDAHHETECEGATTQCPECEATVIQHRLAAHLADDCLEGQTQCKWHAAGCKVADKRRAVQEHDKSGCMFEAVGRLLEQREEDRRVIDSLSGRLSSLEVSRNRRRDRRHDSAQANEASPVTPTSAAPMNIPELTINGGASADNGAWGSPEDYMLAQFERLETQMEELRKQMGEADARHSLSFLQHSTHLNDQLAELANKVGVLNMHTTWLMNMQRQSNAQQRAGAAAGPSNSGASSSAMSHGNEGSGSRTGPSSDNGVWYQGGSRRSSDGRGEMLTRL
jgi:hypothetical protein